MPEPLLEVDNLSVSYLTDAADIGAVDRVSLTVQAGEFLGIVGESGCGKSTLLFAIAQLLTPPAEITSGRVTFKGQDLVQLTESELRHVRWRDYSVVMQSAMNALNPMKSIAERTHMQEGTLARSLLATALDDADPDAARITEILDAIPGAWERTQEGLAQAARGEGMPLGELA